MATKEECEKQVKENQQLAKEWEKSGDYKKANEARDRAHDWEKSRDSWLYRTFGW